MNSLGIVLAYDFASGRVPLRWADIDFGIRFGFFDEYAAVLHAVHLFESLASVDESVLALACRFKGEPVDDLLPQLVEREPVSGIDSPESKFLYLVLAWLYEQRDELSDLWGSVEAVYTDFDYPSEVAEFIPYMPPSRPVLDDATGWQVRLLGYWQHYLQTQQAAYCLPVIRPLKEVE